MTMRSTPGEGQALSLLRADGRLARWNEERGFGFVTSTETGSAFFVHASAFPRDGERPQLGERLSFAIEVDSDGRKCAIDVRRPKATSTLRNSSSRPARGRPNGPALGRWVGVLATLTVVAAAFVQLRQQLPDGLEGAETATASLPRAGARQASAAPAAWQCAGRNHCSQMSSCAEATWVLRNCPATKMDGDNDGVPCESQWCLQ